MALEIQGKLIKILAPVTGEGRNGAWTKQEFVIETFDQYPKKICCSVWSDKVEQLRRYQPGDDIRVSINIESREYNERWFTEVRAWKLDPLSAAQPATAAPGAYNPAGAPAYSAPSAPSSSTPGGNFQPANPPAQDNSFFSSEPDDLPF